MLTGFLSRFTALVDTLIAHARIRVTHVWRGPPATETQLEALAQAWGHTVPRALRVLYRQANGYQLRWMDIGDETYDPARDDRLDFDGPWDRLFEWPGGFSGYLDVPPIEALLERDTVGAGFDSKEEYLHRAVPFDSFGESCDAVLFFGDGADDPWISISTDYLADVDPPGEQTLSHYLDHVLSTWASTAHRWKAGPPTLDGLLRQRATLDASRLVGQRVVYRDSYRGGSPMRGLVLSRTDLAERPREWWYGPTVLEIRDDLGETVYVPLGALSPPDDADDYERLHAEPDALRTLLGGPAQPIFEALASVSPMSARQGLLGGPVLCDHAWPHAALTSRLSPADAASALIIAAETLFTHPDARIDRPIAWPSTRPRLSRPATMCFDTLAAGLFDAAAIHTGRAAPDDLAAWLGLPATARLALLLRRFHSQNPLRGYDPLTDPLTTAAYFFRALQGGPTALHVAAPQHRHGGQIGLASHRLVTS